jgi:hypothetical protein
VQDRDHLTRLLSDALVPIAAEMHGRLDDALSDNDQLAVASAIVKAATAGARLGAIETVAQVEESGRSVELDMQIGDGGDPWAERYGEDA